MARWERELFIRWDKRQKDFVIGGPRKCDMHLIHGRVIGIAGIKEGLGAGLVDELEKRGYDTTTLKFSVRRRHGSMHSDG